MARRSILLLAIFVSSATVTHAVNIVNVTVCNDPDCTIGCVGDVFRSANDASGCDDGRQLIVGNLSFSLTKFNSHDCNRFSDRRVEFGKVGVCGPWSGSRYAIVPVPSSSSPVATVSFLQDCRESQELRLAQGWCNNRGQYSLMPLCLRGRIYIQYFEDPYCRNDSTAMLHQTNACVEPLLHTESGSIQYNCMGYNEAVCLSLKGSAWYIVLIALLPFLSAVPLAGTFFVALFVTFCGKKAENNGEAAAPEPNVAAGAVVEGDVNGASEPIEAAATAESAVSAPKPPPPASKVQVVVIGASMEDEAAIIRGDAASAGLDFVSHPTVSQYSTDTLRGMQVLTSFTGLSGGAFIMQAAIQQTLTGSFCRPGWLFALQCLGYACIVITGLAPSDNVSAHRRQQNAFLCFSCSTVNKWCGGRGCTTTGFTHVASFVTYLILPPVCMAIAYGAYEKSCHDSIELGLIIAMYVCLIIHFFAGKFNARLSFLSEMLTVGLSLILYIYYETGIMWQCALVS